MEKLVLRSRIFVGETFCLSDDNYSEMEPVVFLRKNYNVINGLGKANILNQLGLSAIIPCFRLSCLSGKALEDLKYYEEKKITVIRDCVPLNKHLKELKYPFFMKPKDVERLRVDNEKILAIPEISRQLKEVEKTIGTRRY